ncbi:MAG TPA: HDOD domain-containing protein, partial [Kofleriaceae bacterium]|nr:HDOD domain-containing protein [Kofleriaceae bacterium]
MQVIPAPRRPTLTPFEDAVDRLELGVSAPTVIQKLLNLLADPRRSARDVEKVLTADASLVTRLLKLASSAAYARHPVRDLMTAIQLVGLTELRKLAVTAHFAHGHTRLARELWSYSLAVAFACEGLARLAPGRVGPDPFLCGLLHDIGTLVLDRLFPARYGRLPVVPGDARQCELELQTFGFAHTDLGAMTVARWNLFPELELVAQLHHDPLAADRLHLPPSAQAALELVALARLSFLAGSDAITDGDPADAALEAELARRVGVTVDDARVHARSGRA